MIKVLVADDHAIVRKGLVQIISDTLDIQVTDEAASAEEVFATTRAKTFDVIVLDLDLGEDSGLEVLRVLSSEKPDLPVLILSVHPEEQYAVRLLQAGAAGYLNKDSAPDRLVAAIRRVVDGRRYVSPLVAEGLLDALEHNTAGLPHERLSEREFQVLRLIASGKTVTEIGDMLSLSVKTISTYRTRVLEKLSLSNNAELTRYAIEHNLVQ